VRLFKKHTYTNTHKIYGSLKYDVIPISFATKNVLVYGTKEKTDSKVEIVTS
jgi:hypothetical protein